MDSNFALGTSIVKNILYLYKLDFPPSPAGGSTDEPSQLPSLTTVSPEPSLDAARAFNLSISSLGASE